MHARVHAYIQYRHAYIHVYVFVDMPNAGQGCRHCSDIFQKRGGDFLELDSQSPRMFYQSFGFLHLLVSFAADASTLLEAS